MIKTLRQIQRLGRLTEAAPAADPQLRVAQALQADILRVLGRALCIRQVDAGSCNGCELEIHALNNGYYNIEGLGVQFVATPRHAGLLLATGPVARHMAVAGNYGAAHAAFTILEAGGNAVDAGESVEGWNGVLASGGGTIKRRFAVSKRRSQGRTGPERRYSPR